jgi:hypothetical protein
MLEPPPIPGSSAGNSCNNGSHKYPSYPILSEFNNNKNQYPRNISLMISSCDILSVSNYIHIYPMKISAPAADPRQLMAWRGTAQRLLVRAGPAAASRGTVTAPLPARATAPLPARGDGGRHRPCDCRPDSKGQRSRRPGATAPASARGDGCPYAPS